MNPFKRIKELEARVKSLEENQSFMNRYELADKLDALTRMLSSANHVIDPSLRVQVETKLKELIEKL